MATNNQLTGAVENYFTDLARVYASGGATGEQSSYGPLSNLLNAVGATLKPKVFCVGELADQGAGRPDFGLFSAKQVQRGKPREGQTPERGVMEVKTIEDDASATADSEQVYRYLARYGLVLVTNQRDFVLVGKNESGHLEKLETFRLAENADDFRRKIEKPRAFARDVGVGLGEYLARTLSHRAAIADPKDLAWLLASYARDALVRAEAADDSPALEAVRAALEEALGIHFEGEKGERFFHSTLVQTLFYGIFSAWVLWARQPSPPATGEDKFDWRKAVWHLRAPVIRALYQQLSGPGRLGPLGLVEVLDWAAAALDRVDREAFFTRFNEGEAVQYFYEPFLDAFDPALRKELGVWYTPPEVVRYMVARVDKALKDDLGIAEGLAAENVYVLDPCCGTGAYLGEVLRRIAANFKDQGADALVGERVRLAATKRVFGFEIMPAPFVVAHLQVGLTLRDLDASLDEDETERAQVFLTNALTGWEFEEPKQLSLPELAEERERAEQVKQSERILVILGNPPYNGFAGTAVDDERKLSQAYRATKDVRPPEGQGLNDLYVRFFRMAERRIVEKTGRGVVCFISNYSWLDGLSFTGMRERYLEAFDAVRIDCLNGDIRKGNKTPEGKTDSSIFTTKDGPGIQVGTAIATLVRKGEADHQSAGTVSFRNLWGQTKQADLIATAEAEPGVLYENIEPVLKLGLSFMPTTVSADWFDWPSLPDLFPKSFPGVKTSRDGFLVDIDLDRLRRRVNDYFDTAMSHDEIARRFPGIMKSAARFNARSVRDKLLKRGGPFEAGFVRFAYRPFDERWLYWEKDTKLLDEKRADYKPHVFEGNLWIEAREREANEDFSRGSLVRYIADNLGNGLSSYFPLWLRDEVTGGSNSVSRAPNLSEASRKYIERLGADVEDLFHYVLSTLHDPAYREANAGALRIGWPRIPLPGWPDGDAAGAAETLRESAARGREIARLLDSEAPVPGVTEKPQPAFAAIAAPATKHGRNMSRDDFSVTAGWGRRGSGDAVMPGRGQAVERAYTPQERAALKDDVLPTLGKTTFDIYLNADAFWRNVPAAVWNYKLGGYQVLKKWLSYREHKVLDRPLHSEEVQHFTNTARRITALLIQEFKK